MGRGGRLLKPFLKLTGNSYAVNNPRCNHQPLRANGPLSLALSLCEGERGNTLPPACEGKATRLSERSGGWGSATSNGEQSFHGAFT